MRSPLPLSLLWLAYLLAPALAPAHEDPVAQLAQSEAAAAIRLAQSPRGAVQLMRLHALRDEVADLDILALNYREILRERRSDSMVRAMARAFAADVERARGRLSEAAELSERLGYIDNFYVLGSFDNEGKGGCSIDFGPEARLDLRASYPAKGHAAEWRKLTLASPDGYVDLAASLRPNRETVGYALTFLQSPIETRTVLAVGTSGAFRLWVNGCSPPPRTGTTTRGPTNPAFPSG